MSDGYPLIPWESCNIPVPIQKELARRKKNRGLDYRKTAGWNPDEGGDWEQYKGPMTSWVRVCSNGNGEPNKNTGEFPKPGFVMATENNFYQTYGIGGIINGNQQIIGYTPDGKQPHVIEYDRYNSDSPIFVPAPQIVKVESIINKELFRKAWIHWKCFSPQQLEYMTPYFLVPRLSVLIEFGWNHFNQNSLVDLASPDSIAKLQQYMFTNPYPLYNENILDSNGNYDLVYGLISDFEWSMDGNQINCITEVMSKNRLEAGIPVSATMVNLKNGENSPDENSYYSSIRDLCENNFIKNLKAIAVLPDLNEVEPTVSNQNISPTNIIKKSATSMFPPSAVLAAGSLIYDFANPINIEQNLKSTAVVPPANKSKTALSNNQLFNFIKFGGHGDDVAMKEEYWRGVFWGRLEGNLNQNTSPTNIIKKVAPSMFPPSAALTAGSLIYNEFTNPIDIEQSLYESDAAQALLKSTPSENDFDKNFSSDSTWVNMGFLVELLNRTFPAASPIEGVAFFKVNIDNTVIGAHPNLISTDGGVMLIPNAIAPKYMWAEKTGWIWDGLIYDYNSQVLPNARVYDFTKKPDDSDPLWYANKQLSTVFNHGTRPRRDNLDEIININRNNSDKTKDLPKRSYAFPFIINTSVEVDGRDNKAEYDPYFYGYLKDVYFNVQKFVDLVKQSDIRTHNELYAAIFDKLNTASGDLWELKIVENENTAELTVQDNKMTASGNNKSSSPLYFDYLDADQLMTGLSFKPKMSDAQTLLAMFGETNNSGSKAIMKDAPPLLNYRFTDRIMSLEQGTAPKPVESSLTPTVSKKSNNNTAQDAFKSKIAVLQELEIGNQDVYQVTCLIKNQSYYRRLVLPDIDLLKCLLCDGDYEHNQIFTGIQPITIEVSLQGVGGFRTFMTFLIRNLPRPYHHNEVAYRIADVHHTIQDGKWETTLRAGIIPLRGYVRRNLGIADEGDS